jgi:hypothetical protein
MTPDPLVIPAGVVTRNSSPVAGRVSRAIAFSPALWRPVMS